MAEVEGSGLGAALKNNASTCLLLYNEKASSRARLGHFLGLSELAMEQYASLGRGAAYREVLIKEMDRSSVRVVKTSLYEHALLTSAPDECLRIEALRAAQGSLEKGIAAWVKEQG